jgi:hypothetical protein
MGFDLAQLVPCPCHRISESGRLKKLAKRDRIERESFSPPVVSPTVLSQRGIAGCTHPNRAVKRFSQVALKERC